MTPIWRSTASGSRRCKNKTSLLGIQTTAPVPFGTGAAFWAFRTRPPAGPGTGAPGRGRRGRNGPGCSRTPGDGRSAPLPSRERTRVMPPNTSRRPSSIRLAKVHSTTVWSPLWKNWRISHRSTVPRQFHSVNHQAILSAPWYSGPQLSMYTASGAKRSRMPVSRLVSHMSNHWQMAASRCSI